MGDSDSFGERGVQVSFISQKVYSCFVIVNVLSHRQCTLVLKQSMFYLTESVQLFCNSQCFISQKLYTCFETVNVLSHRKCTVVL